MANRLSRDPVDDALRRPKTGARGSEGSPQAALHAILGRAGRVNLAQTQRRAA